MGVMIHIFILLFPDIDECASGTDDCHSSVASCTNIVGSFSCTCNNPYSGNGRTCNLPSGNEEDVQLTNPKSLVVDAPCAYLDSHCVNSTLLLTFIRVWKDGFWDCGPPCGHWSREYFCFLLWTNTRARNGPAWDRGRQYTARLVSKSILMQYLQLL